MEYTALRQECHLKVALAISSYLEYADISVLIDTQRHKTFNQGQKHNMSLAYL